MARLGRAKSGSHSKSPELTRKPLPDDSPKSPTTRRTPKYDVDFVGGSKPSTPEGWILFAQTKLYTVGKAAEVVQGLADVEPDLLEFLMCVDEEIRGAVRDSVCGSAFPTTRALWLNSISCSLFLRFLTYFNRLPPNLNLVDRTIEEACRQVTPYMSVLSALGQIQFVTVEREEEEFTTKKSQKKRKASIAMRARQNTTTVDPRLFIAVDLDYPTTPQELQEVETEVLQRLQVLLEVLLGAFESPELGTYSKSLAFDKSLQQISQLSTSSATVNPIAKEPNTILASKPGAFPHIRPLAAAKYFDEGSALGAWSIIISGRAVNNLRQMRKGDSHVFAMVEKKITELSQGFFSESNQKRLVGLDTEVPIYEAKVSRDIRIVYQIDLDTDVDAKLDKQIIRIYGVYTHAQLDNRLWSLISHYHIDRRGKECLHRETPRAPGQNVTLPAHFPHEEDADTPEDSAPLTTLDANNMTEKDLLNLHSLIALEKFIPMSQSLIDAILNDSDANHVFQVSAKEKEIIYHDSACFVLGRSGTGKTTSIIFKMIGIEKLYEQMEEMAKPRQVFVTQSRVLAQRVQDYYQSLVTSTTDTLNEPSKSPEDEEQVLADLDDEDASAFGLPPKYSMLEDRHFPLFLTFDQLCSLLEADFGLQFKRLTRTKAHAAAEKRFALSDVADVKIDLDQDDEVAQEDVGKPSSPVVETTERMLAAKQAAVTFEVFVAAYWPHFDYQIIKGLDPALVYSEFLGVIEGSEAALLSKSGALSRDEYTSLSHKKSSFASQRGRVYDLYEAYRKRKRQLGGYDAAERTHALVAATKERVPGFKFDCLYIDEAQDNLLIDMKLLHNLSNNPHGIFVAGDTAQTISAGSSFRFEDLKAFLWRLEEQDEVVLLGKRKAIHPTLFHLAVNYRSHGGIVDCASSITQLISELFPYSIDKLKKETGITDGPKPIFFSGWERGVVRFEQFLRGEAETKIDFGASQVILVRNEAARDALREQVGEIGLILTLYESKGLEFDDVLLYNFFEDSVPGESTWRVILQGLHGKDIGPIPRFDEIRHAVICTELKNLYVGLTRARNHCWIWDLSEKAEPMKLFWRKQGFIKECGPKDPMPQLSVSSTEADWAKSGRLLFNKRLYPQAMFCFEKADLLVERDIAAAYESRKQARLLQAAKSADRAARRAAFTKAASDFLGCAILSKGKQQTSCYLRAAECYLQAEDWKAAAEAFYSANEFDLAARNFRRAGCFDEAVGVVKNHKGHIQKNVADEIIGVARLEYLRTDRLEQASGLFDEVEEQLEYMEDYGFTGALIRVLEHHKRYEQAAEAAFAERNVVEGVRLLSQSSNPSSVRAAIERALRGLWMMIPFGLTGDKRQNPAISLLIGQLSGNNSRMLSDEESRELEAFQALRDNKVEHLLTLAQANGTANPDFQTSTCSILALLCFSHSSRLLVPHRNSTVPEFIQKAGTALSYIIQLLRFSRPFHVSFSDAQKLLGFEPVEPVEFGGDKSTPPEYWIHSTSLMFEAAQKRLGAVAPIQSALGLSSLAITELDTRHLALTILYDTVQSEVRKMHTAANLAFYLYPCLEFAIFGKCHRPGCGNQEVNSRDLPNEQRQDFFNQRTRALILQIQIVHSYQLRVYQSDFERRDFRRIWARRLYENLMPHFPPLGSVVCVDPKRIPEFADSNGAISAWCEDALHELDPGFAPQSKFLSDVLVYLDLSFRIHRQSYIPKLHSRRLVRWRDDLMITSSGPAPRMDSIVPDFINFYVRKSQDVISRAVRAVHHIVFKGLAIEANVLVNILEFVGREIIVQWRWCFRGAGGIFDRLLVPRSWAFELVKRPPLPLQKGIPLGHYMLSLYKTLEILRGHDPKSSPLYGFNSSPGILMRSVLILRICRLLVLVADNALFSSSAKDGVRRSIIQSLTGSGDISAALCTKFLKAGSWTELWNAVRYSALNRGADELVYLSLRRDGYRPPTITAVKSVVYSKLNPELEQLLSLVEPTKPTGAALNPEAKSFIPPIPTHVSTDIEDVDEPNQTAIVAQSKADDIPDLVTPDIDPSSSSQDEPQRPLTTSDIESGKTILFCFRRYALRQRIRMRKAVKIIWSYYLRHRLRHKAPMTATEEQIRKLHNEYQNDVESIDCPLLYVKGFKNHERVLLGLMPHVLVYLQGLERVNQQQKEANKKRLQIVQHEELERVRIRMDACAALAKKIKALAKRIAPGSRALHQIDTLREEVKQVDLLRLEVMHTFGEDAISKSIEEHYPLGISVILSPPPMATESKPLKPDLNVSDLVI